ncbi:ubiquitin-conjugating enzyme E2 Z-like [Dermacentor andersoni]|uniref:ubiquitin-conjugating enzyme E2 Z-like n=1 Tax=Dermacentor andersoni TaxID=34620 RepID=UPI002154FCEB|nr:ubiquitin-conjugating enzyme E2 Z-like [Dermacentor andersoni]
MARPTQNYLDNVKKEEPTPQCLQRVQRDLVEFHADPPQGVFVVPEDSDMSVLHAIVVGPWGTPLEGGLFHLQLKCPPDYPMRPPRVRFLTGAGKVSFNSHIRGEHICLSLLGTAPNGPSWSSALSIGSLLVSIQSFLADGAMEIMRHNAIRVAVCDTLEVCLQETSEPPMPPALTQKVLKYFAENYAKYEDAVQAQINSWGVFSLILGVAYGSYEPLLKRLRDIKKKIDEKNVTATGQQNNE